MSTYTTQLRYLCETYAGKQQSGDYREIPSIIQAARPKLFDFDYPLYDPSYKPALETKIINHYYFREIGSETAARFKFDLCRTLNEIMPYYNKIYQSANLKFNPLYDLDFKKSHEGSDKKQRRLRNDGSADSDGENLTTTDTDYTSDVINDSRHDGEEHKDLRNTDTRTLDTTDTLTHDTTDTLTHDTTDTLTHDTTDTLTHDTTDTTTLDTEHERSLDLTDETTLDTTDKTTYDTDTTTTYDSQSQTTYDSTETDTYDRTDTRTLGTKNTTRKSDTPQGSLQNIEDNTYLSEASITDNTGTDSLAMTGTIEKAKGGTDTVNHTGSDTIARTGDDTVTHDGTVTLKKTGTDTLADSGTNTLVKTGSDTTTHEGTDTTTHEGTDTTTHTGTDTTTHTGTDTIETIKHEDNTDAGVGHSESHTTDNTFTEERARNKNNKTYNERQEENINGTDEYIDHIYGKTGAASYSALLTEYRETLINIDMMVINELEVCFMNIY